MPTGGRYSRCYLYRLVEFASEACSRLVIASRSPIARDRQTIRSGSRQKYPRWIAPGCSNTRLGATPGNSNRPAFGPNRPSAAFELLGPEHHAPGLGVVELRARLIGHHCQAADHSRALGNLVEPALEIWKVLKLLTLALVTA